MYIHVYICETSQPYNLKSLCEQTKISSEREICKLADVSGIVWQTRRADRTVWNLGTLLAETTLAPQIYGSKCGDAATTRNHELFNSRVVADNTQHFWAAKILHHSLDCDYTANGRCLAVNFKSRRFPRYLSRLRHECAARKGAFTFHIPDSPHARRKYSL